MIVFSLMTITYLLIKLTDCLRDLRRRHLKKSLFRTKREG
jgi:hypothetical protein